MVEGVVWLAEHCWFSDLKLEGLPVSTPHQLETLVEEEEKAEDNNDDEAVPAELTRSVVIGESYRFTFGLFGF